MVQISIDTKKDSPEEIREIIKYLQGVIGESPLAESQETEPAFESAPGAFSMFGDASDDEKSDFSSDFNANEVFGSDDDAPSDVKRNSDDDDDPVIEIVEF